MSIQSLPKRAAEVQRYLGRGWWPIPVCRPIGPGRCREHGTCGKPGKTALIKGSFSRKPSLRSLRRLWSQYPGANVGILLKPSGLMVLDVDRPELLDSLALPITPTSYTGRPEGGRHFYFRISDDIQRNLQGDGIELRVNGIVVAPDSLHASGRAYSWIIAPEEAEVAELPDHAWDTLSPLLEGRNRGLPRLSLSRIARGVPEGARNTSAAQLAGKLLGALDPADWPLAWELLQGWNMRNRPPLPLPELRTVFESIARRELNKHIANPQHRKILEKAVQKLKIDPSLTDRKLYQQTNARRHGLSLQQFKRIAYIARSLAIEGDFGYRPAHPTPGYCVVKTQGREQKEDKGRNEVKIDDYTR